MNGIPKKMIRFISDGDYRFLINANRGKYDSMDDETYLRKKYKAIMGRELDLDSPETFSEKLQWLKLHDRKPEYSVYADKYAVREHIAKTLGEQYLIPLLGVWDSPDEIDFDSLPDKFVLKCTHNSGLGMCICTDKSSLDTSKVRAELKKGLEQNYYFTGREWPYKNIKPRIIAEKYITDTEDSAGLSDYKFFCFNGTADSVMLCLERNTGDTKFYFFDKDWNLKRLNVRGKNAPADFTLPKPECTDEMFAAAEKLSQGFRFIRIDLYQSCGKVYFGEMTFFPDSGFDRNILDETDRYWGGLIKL